jgi:hypothetical protein
MPYHKKHLSFDRLTKIKLNVRADRTNRNDRNNGINVIVNLE